MAEVTVTPGSRLESLLAAYADLKPQVDALTNRFEGVKTALKLELVSAHPDATQIDVTHPTLAQPLRMRYISRWRLDTERLKRDDPRTYVEYAKPAGRWELRGVSDV